MLARNVRRYCRKRCSKTRPTVVRGRASAVIAGQSTSERPVRRRNTSSSDDRRTSTVSGSKPTLVDRDRRRLAVVGVEQHPVGQVLDALGDAVELAVERLGHAGREAQLGDLPGGVLLDERARAAFGDDLGLVHDHEPVAQLLGLVHVVRRQDERHAALLEPVEPVPQQVPRLRVEAGRRLVEEQQVGLVDEGAGDRQPSLHPARQRLDLVAGPLGELGEVEQLVRAARRPRRGQPEVAAVDDEVLADRQLVVEGVLLWDDAEARADLRAVRGGVHAQDDRACPR